MNEVIDALNTFEIVEKTGELALTRNKYAKLLLAVKNLASTKAIKLDPKTLSTTKLQYFRTALNQSGKKMGLKIGVSEKDGYWFVFNR